MNTPRIMIIAGGTGGHIFPALTVASELRQQGWRVSWMGTPDSMESEIVPKHDIPLRFVNVAGLRGKGLWHKVTGSFAIVGACRQARRILQQEKPDVVLGMGGFVAGPGGLMARMLGIPLVIHEQNAIAGLTNRILARFATRVLSAFPFVFHDSAKLHVVGNPVRDSVIRIEHPEDRYREREGDLRVLVVGGSRGARTLNEEVPEALALQHRGFKVKHQAGKGNAESVKDKYRAAGIEADVLEFIDDMAAAYAWADLVICRAGAMTVFEIAACGVAAIFVPYPHAVDDHQTANADWLVSAGAAEILHEDELTAETLAEVIARVADSRHSLEAMAERARERAMPDAGVSVARHCVEVAEVAS